MGAQQTLTLVEGKYKTNKSRIPRTRSSLESFVIEPRAVIVIALVGGMKLFVATRTSDWSSTEPSSALRDGHNPTEAPQHADLRKKQDPQPPLLVSLPTQDGCSLSPSPLPIPRTQDRIKSRVWFHRRALAICTRLHEGKYMYRLLR